jgi:biotin carboxyl carrier protein
MDHLRITIAGKSYEVTVEKIVDESPAAPSPVVRPAAAARVTIPTTAPPTAAPKAAAAGDATSPLAGIVQAIDATVGSTIKEGDTVITLEAMKMYTPINATASGTITAIHVKVGDAVEEGQVLYTIS